MARGLRSVLLESCSCCSRRVDRRFLQEVQGARLCVSCRMDLKTEGARLLEASVNERARVIVWRVKKPFRFR